MRAESGQPVCKVERRITFFVDEVQSSAEGWVLTGEVGLGPLDVGDRFSFVHHQDSEREDVVELVVLAISETRLYLSPAEADLRHGDILGGVK